MRVSLTLITAQLSLQGLPVSFDIQWEDITVREPQVPGHPHRLELELLLQSQSSQQPH